MIAKILLADDNPLARAAIKLLLADRTPSYSDLIADIQVPIAPGSGCYCDWGCGQPNIYDSGR